jgi:hypothetical protein
MKRETIIAEFEHIKKAPVSILISTIILSAIIWAFLDSYVYKTEIQNLKSKIDLLNTQVSIYKGKNFTLGETEFSKMSNSELKAKAKNKLTLIKKSYKDYHALDTLKKIHSMSWEESNKFYDLQSTKSSQMIVDYELNHKAEIILLREQMLLRLPKAYIKSSSIDRYLHIVNPLGYKEILNDFEKLVLNLPEK